MGEEKKSRYRQIFALSFLFCSSWCYLSFSQYLFSPILLSPAVNVLVLSTLSPSTSIPSSSGDLREEGWVSQAGSPPVHSAGLDGICAGGSDQEGFETLSGTDQQVLRDTLRPYTSPLTFGCKIFCPRSSLLIPLVSLHSRALTLSKSSR